MVNGHLVFDGLIASLDGTEILRTSREGSWSVDDVLAAGTDAGDELKAKAPKDFFANVPGNAGYECMVILICLVIDISLR